MERIAYEVLTALKYLHSEKVTHRNLTLKNIQLDKKVSNDFTNLYKLKQPGSLGLRACPRLVAQATGQDQKC